ncbi:serine hydrolase domain-containing protein [Nonomuraea sp. NPDC050328]|uniref:serine hydrolase domain-containing protein n=1 Tax=Nonomuraea sp. NPDC050328 TaxID=3364361 RepID=UPI00379B701C
MRLDERLAELAARHGVPGAAVAVLAGGEVRDAATGVLNLATGWPVTIDALFQIGSITKLWTAALVMELDLDLDAEVRELLPGFRAGLTPRHLLTHTSGLEGDLYDDFGPGDDALERYVAALDELAPQVFPAGERFSYCNTGYCVLGRIVEVVTGLSWERAVEERLAGPLGLTVATSAGQAILGRPAVGHEGGQVVPVWAMPRSNAPAGSSLAMSARDLVRFAGAHLDAAWAVSPQVRLPRGMARRGDWWSLGWEGRDWPGGPVIGHDGSTNGQAAFLRAVPGTGVAVALVTNGGAGRALFDDLAPSLLGVTPPAPPPVPAEAAPCDPARFEGRYAARAVSVEVRREPSGGFLVTLTDEDEGESETTTALPADAATLVAPDGTSLVFAGEAGDGGSAFVYLSARALPRTGEAQP